MHCIRPCSALHPPLQCTASVPAVHCLFSRKYVQPSPQVRAIVPASTCVRTCKYVNPFLQVFLLNPENGGLITKAKSRILQNHRISCLIQIKALFLPLDYEPWVASVYVRQALSRHQSRLPVTCSVLLCLNHRQLSTKQRPGEENSPDIQKAFSDALVLTM